MQQTPAVRQSLGVVMRQALARGAAVARGTVLAHRAVLASLLLATVLPLSGCQDHHAEAHIKRLEGELRDAQAKNLALMEQVASCLESRRLLDAKGRDNAADATAPPASAAPTTSAPPEPSAPAAPKRACNPNDPLCNEI